MYLSHFGLNEPPFRITPHTEFFYDGANRGPTLEALLYAVTHDEGIVKVTGEVGSGKTMLCRVLLERLPKTVETIYLANPSLSRDEILRAIAEDLRMDVRGKRTTLLLRALQDSGASVVTLVAKSHDRHVDLALKTSLDENLAMIKDSIEFLRTGGQRVFLDAEHFFDGYLSNKAYALEVVRTAAEAGADVIALCDTNGGMLPDELSQVVHDVLVASSARLGIHCHNDTGCAVANSLAAISAGVTHVQGTLNGYGERTGNADLVSIIANLELKKHQKVLPDGALREAFRISHAVAEVTNVAPRDRKSTRLNSSHG